MTREIAVIGGGPAGMAAAVSAAQAGASVTLIDSETDLGGQFWRHLPESRSAEREELLHHKYGTYRALAERIRGDERIRVLNRASVWSLDRTVATDTAPPAIEVVQGSADSGERERIRLQPDAIIIATGAHDRTLPFTGWTLPGVYTGGAAQALAKRERVAVGERVVVAGAGVFLLPVAASLAATGATVVGVFEIAHVPQLASGWLRNPWELARSTGKMTELVGYAAGHVKHRIPYRTGVAIVRAEGDGRVERVVTAKVDANWRPIPGTERTIECDALCVTHGFTPRLEIALAAGCTFETGFVAVDSEQRTSVPGVYAAGEVTGIGGSDHAIATGRVAGLAAAGAQGVASGEAARERARQRRFVTRIAAAHGIRDGWRSWLEDDTIVCRCESVTAGQIERSVTSSNDTSYRAQKLATRAGLGPCQGRICGRTVEGLLQCRASEGECPTDTTSDRRPIAVPIRLSELAREAHEFSDASTPQQQREKGPTP